MHLTCRPVVEEAADSFFLQGDLGGRSSTAIPFPRSCVMLLLQFLTFSADKSPMGGAAGHVPQRARLILEDAAPIRG